MDLNLLISVIGGLGRVETTADGGLVFCKDEDCLGAAPSPQPITFKHRTSDTQSNIFAWCRVPERPAEVPSRRRS